MICPGVPDEQINDRRRAVNGLPPDTDVSFLRGATLGQICIGTNELILNIQPAGDPRIEPGTSIMTECAVRLVQPTREEVTSDDSTVLGPLLVPLLGIAVSSVSILAPGTLRLTWASGHILDLIDSESRYESYVITHGKKVIVV
jgi:hypothetical protein